MVMRPDIDRSDARVGRKLLRYLRDTFDSPDMGYRQPPTRLLGGYETDVYAFELSGVTNGLSGPLVLRVMREDHAPHHAALEAVTQSYAAAQGFPAPRVHAVCADPQAVGGRFVVMERVPGAQLAEDIMQPLRLLVGLPRIMRRVPRIMADLQADLHALDPVPWLDALQAEGVSAYAVGIESRLDRIAGLLQEPGLETLHPVLQWLVDHRPPPSGHPVICHGDLHPLNILMHDGEVSGVIDWSNVAFAEREYDIARTHFPLRFGPVDLPAVLMPLVQALRGTLAARYLRDYARHHAFDRDRVRYYEVLIGLLEVANGLPWRPARSANSGPSAYGNPALAQAVLAHISSITGIPVDLPAEPTAARAA